jgi:hypothetical protein
MSRPGHSQGCGQANAIMTRIDSKPVLLIRSQGGAIATA